jgi:hypothetical protein
MFGGVRWLNVDIIGKIILIVAVIYFVNLIFREGLSRFYGYVFRGIAGIIHYTLFRLRRIYKAANFFQIFFGLARTIAVTCIMFLPYIMAQSYDNMNLKIVAFLKEGYIGPVALLVIALYNWFFSPPRALPLPKSERIRLVRTWKGIRGVGNGLGRKSPDVTFEKEQRILLECIANKVRYYVGSFEGLEIQAALLIPTVDKFDSMRVVARSDTRDIGVEYPIDVLAAGEAVKNNRANVVHSLKRFAKKLRPELRSILKSKPYKSVLAIPVRRKDKNGGIGIVGAVSIDADCAYYFWSWGICLEIALSPYLGILAMTLPEDTPSFRCQIEPGYLKY